MLIAHSAGYYDNGITAERIDAAIDNPENNVFILLRRGDVTVAVLAALANAAPIGGGEVEIFLDFIIAMPGYGRALMRELVYNFAVSLGPGPTHSMAVTICTCATPEAEPFFRHLGFKRTRLISFGPLPMVLRLDFP